MTDLYHVVLKDHDNSGYVWDEFTFTASVIWREMPLML